jgi:hypothetical protein
VLCLQFYGMLRDLLRFNKEAIALLETLLWSQSFLV